MNRFRSSTLGMTLNIGLFVLALVALCVVINYFAQRPEFRSQIDATKTRAYSLTPQTRQLLGSLQGAWTIAVILDEQRADRAMRRQIDEVLRRYTDASPNISIVRIDPTDPRTLGRYESFLESLQRNYREPVAKYDQALDAGTDAFRTLMLFAQQQSGKLDPVLRSIPSNDPHRQQLEQLAQVLGRLGDQGDVVLNEVLKARRSSDARPIPDYETARSILVQALSEYATQLDDMGQLLGQWSGQAGADEAVRSFAATTRADYQAIAQQLGAAANPLKQLPPMELSSIGQTLAEGEAAVILSPTRAAVIPSSQLFPKSNIQARENGAVTFDQRFRGEQLISATLRSLTVDAMPTVVFVHAEDKSLLFHHDNDADLAGVASMLRASRFKVAEWLVGKQKDPPDNVPDSKSGQPVVWVIIPPPPARSIESTPAVNALLEATRRLLSDGEPMLFSFAPSLLPKYGQRDPMASLIERFGVHPDTGRIVLQSIAAERGAPQLVLGQPVREFSTEHRIGRAVDGQQAYFGLPIPLKLEANPRPESELRQFVIAQINPDAPRWLETDWTADLANRTPTPESEIHEPVTVVVAAERTDPAFKHPQRLVVVGSGGWMLTNVADRTQSIGGDRIALENPGNHELMLASVAWLSGMDDLIAASPISQETPRLRDLTPTARTAWFFALTAGLPAICIALGVGMWVTRRR